MKDVSLLQRLQVEAKFICSLQKAFSLLGDPGNYMVFGR